MHIFKYKSSIQNSSKGFTLIELMVSLSVFAIVMVVSTGTLLTFIDANAKAQAVYEATENLAFALDSMTREIRTGYHYYCPDITLTDLPTIDSNNPQRNYLPVDCSDKDSIAFIREKDGKQYGYRLDAGKLEQRIEPSGKWLPITSNNVVIDVFKLSVNNAETYYDIRDPLNIIILGNVQQPTVDITIKGHVNNGLDTDTDFNIQTRIVQRSLDIY